MSLQVSSFKFPDRIVHSPFYRASRCHVYYLNRIGVCIDIP